MLMGLHGLFDQGWVEWITSMTYQAASGAGAANMRELVQQMRALGQSGDNACDQPAVSALQLERHVTDAMRSDALPTDNFTAPLAGSLLPWIDRAVEDVARVTGDLLDALVTTAPSRNREVEAAKARARAAARFGTARS